MSIANPDIIMRKISVLVKTGISALNAMGYPADLYKILFEDGEIEKIKKFLEELKNGN